MDQFYFDLVSAATHSHDGEERHTAIRCRRRPDRRACEGHIIVKPLHRMERVDFRCSECDFETGDITGITEIEERTAKWKALRPSVGKRTVLLRFESIHLKRIRETRPLDDEALCLLLSAELVDGKAQLKLGEQEAKYVGESLIEAALLQLSLIHI